MKLTNNIYFGPESEVKPGLESGSMLVTTHPKVRLYAYDSGKQPHEIGKAFIESALKYPVENSYTDQSSMLGDQGSQTMNYFQYQIDEDKYWEYLGTTTGTINDYRELTPEEVIIIEGNSKKPIHLIYANAAARFAAQHKQKEGFIYRDADDDSHWEYLGTRNGNATDYKIIGGSSSDGALQAKVTLSAAQILALDTTPVTIVPAPGAGKVIVPYMLTGRLNYNTTASDANKIYIQISGAGSAFNGQLHQNFVTSTTDGIIHTTSAQTSSSLTPNTAANAALEVSSDYGGTVGDSTVDIYVSYEIVTL